MTAVATAAARRREDKNAPCSRFSGKGRFSQAEVRGQRSRRMSDPPGRILAVASGGGHLVELRELVSRVAPDADVSWVTSDRPQGRSLLRGERATFVRAVEPREVSSVLANVPTAVRL